MTKKKIDGKDGYWKYTREGVGCFIRASMAVKQGKQRTLDALIGQKEAE